MFLQFEFRICPAWSKKPMTVDAKSTTDASQEMMGPGSDIVKAHPDQIVGHFNNTHFLALNAFCIFRPQYLLLTNDSHRSQNEPLDLDDISAAVAFLESVESEHYVFYNCTKDAGCSRYHKHMQILKKPAADSTFRFFPDADDSNTRVPYQHSLHRFTLGEPLDSKEVYDIYSGFLEECKQTLGIKQTTRSTLCPHNMVLTKEWMIMIPRRSNDCNGIGANAAGMLGMPMMSDEKTYDIWMRNGPAKMLAELGVPADRAT